MKFFFERRSINAIERKEIIDKAFVLAQEIIRRAQIDEKKFSGLYDPKEILKDSRYVEKRTADFQKDLAQGRVNPDSIKLGTIFEAITIAAREWFGENAQTIKTSKYDDIANGIDLIAELSREKEKVFVGEIGLAVDVTFNEEFEGKIDRIKKEIEEGKLSSVKYFESSQRKFKGQLSDIVRVVISASRDTVIDLAEVLLVATKNPKILFEHQFQFQALEEIIAQLKAYEEYARSLGKNNLADRYKKVLSLVLFTRKERDESIGDKRIRDPMSDKLDAYLSSKLKRKLD
jgi:hypothetical protein